MILTDDQRFDELGFLNPEIETPNLDKLANGGVFFRNAFVTPHHEIWDTDELYDLENDPREMNNLINQPQYKPLVRELREKLYGLNISTDGAPSVPFTMKQGSGLHFRLRDGQQAAEFPESISRDGDESDLETYKD
ncbi:sulfatase/phosphatase domain-containing protein [Pseudomonadota bacterium]